MSGWFFFSLLRIEKMDFIDFEASEDITDNEPLLFSDEENDINNDQMGDFIDDTDQQREGVSFYRWLKPEKFPNQTRNPEDAVYEDDDPFFGIEDTQPELYNPMDGEFVTFNKFKGFESSFKKFKKTLKNFNDSDNSFFDAIIYGIMFYKCEGKILEKGKVAEVLGSDFYNELLEIKDEIKLDRAVFGYFDTCFKLDDVLSNHNFFHKFSSDKMCSGFLYSKKLRGKTSWQETFPVLLFKSLMDMKRSDED